MAISRLELMKTALFALSVSLIACGRGESRDRPPTRAVAIDTAGGEVVADAPAAPAAATARWISDANALALVTALNSRQIAAADIELENWHVDTARAFAASMAREHAELQHAIDSTARSLKLVPVTPALAKPWAAAMQAQIDTMRRAGENSLDLTFVRQQIGSHQLMSNYFLQLASAAERPELRGFLESAAAKVSSQAQRASALLPVVVRIDSVRREGRRRGATP
jgi:predicted outer membrane protein